MIFLLDAKSLHIFSTWQKQKQKTAYIVIFHLKDAVIPSTQDEAKDNISLQLPYSEFMFHNA